MVAYRSNSPVFLRSVMGMYGSWLFVFLRLMTGLFWYVLQDVDLLSTAEAFKVRYTDILGCKSDIYLPAVYVWASLAGSTQHSARVGGHFNQATDLFLRRLALTGTVRKSQCRSHAKPILTLV